MNVKGTEACLMQRKQHEIDCTLTRSLRKCVRSSGYSLLVMYQL